jgi:hypothetical protein
VEQEEEDEDCHEQEKGRGGRGVWRCTWAYVHVYVHACAHVRAVRNAPRRVHAGLND